MARNDKEALIADPAAPFERTDSAGSTLQSAGRRSDAGNVARRLAAMRDRTPEFAAALAVALVATVAGSEVPVVGGPVFGIVLGALLATWLRPGATLRPGLTFAS